jgi:CubicO group peptidase (beta-lactamase class C family)
MIKRFVNLLFSIEVIFCSQVNGQDISKRIDSLFNAVTNNSNMHFSGSVVVSEKGKIIYKNSKGYANIKKKILNDPATNFSLASLSKVFTAIAVMQLKENGKLNLDDPLIKYLSDFPFSEITIRQILTHTSGLPDFEIFGNFTRAPVGNHLSYKDIIPALKNTPKLLFAPGTQWHYSSVGFGLLALLVETVSQEPFSRFIEEKICMPAGLVSTYVDIPECGMNDRSKAKLYVNPRTGSSDITSADTLKTDLANPFQAIAGPGLIVSSVNDLLRFVEALNMDKLLAAETKQEMFAPAKLKNGEFAQLDHAPLYNALGWGIDKDSSMGKVASHNGGSPGISTILLINLPKQQVVIVLENTDNHIPMLFGINAMNILDNKTLVHFRED